MRMRFSDDTPDHPSESMPELDNEMIESAKANSNGWN